MALEKPVAREMRESDAGATRDLEKGEPEEGGASPKYSDFMVTGEGAEKIHTKTLDGLEVSTSEDLFHSALNGCPRRWRLAL